MHHDRCNSKLMLLFDMNFDIVGDVNIITHMLQHMDIGWKNTTMFINLDCVQLTDDQYVATDESSVRKNLYLQQMVHLL